jgi:hypothetical protein
MTNTIIDQILELNPEALTADGYDRSIKGIGDRDGKPVLLYSSDKCIQQLMEDNDWTYDDALDFFTFNTESAYAGESTPLFEWDEEEQPSTLNDYFGSC